MEESEESTESAKAKKDNEEKVDSFDASQSVSESVPEKILDFEKLFFVSIEKKNRKNENFKMKIYFR